MGTSAHRRPRAWADLEALRFATLDRDLSVLASTSLYSGPIAPGALAIGFDGIARAVTFADESGALHVVWVDREGTVLVPDRVVETGAGRVDGTVRATTLAGAVYVTYSDGEVQLTRICR